MSTELPTFQRKQKLLAAQLQALSDAIRANRILPGFGIRVTGSPNGTTIAVRTKGGAVSDPPDTHPFQIFRSPFEGEGTPPANQPRRVRVRYGLANNTAPSNIDEEFIMPTGVTNRRIYMKVSLQHVGLETTVTEIEIEQGSSTPADSPGPNPATVYRTIGFVTTNETSITEITLSVRSNITGQMRTTFWTCTEQNREWAWLV